MWPTERERVQINKLIDGLDVESFTFKIEPDSPWLQIDMWVHLEGERQYALWRTTGAIYKVIDGAAEDDPCIEGIGYNEMPDIREAAEIAVHALIHVLPISGSWNGGYSVPDHIDPKVIAMVEEWADAAKAVADLHAALTGRVA